jgi:hypothetical protein
LRNSKYLLLLFYTSTFMDVEGKRSFDGIQIIIGERFKYFQHILST